MLWKENAVQSRKGGRKYWQLYVMVFSAFIYILLFAYEPMYGIRIAFQNYSLKKGIWGSPWVGLGNFGRLFHSYWFPVILKNTLSIRF